MLLQRVASQDRRAFASLYAASSSKLYGIILRILKRRDVAEDILQDVYVRIWERAMDFDSRKAPAIAWMIAIARNRALDERRRAAVGLDAIDADADDLARSSPPIRERRVLGARAAFSYCTTLRSPVMHHRRWSCRRSIPLRRLPA